MMVNYKPFYGLPYGLNQALIANDWISFVSFRSAWGFTIGGNFDISTARLRMKKMLRLYHDYERGCIHKYSNDDTYGSNYYTSLVLLCDQQQTSYHDPVEHTYDCEQCTDFPLFCSSSTPWNISLEASRHWDAYSKTSNYSHWTSYTHVCYFNVCSDNIKTEKTMIIGTQTTKSIALSEQWLYLVRLLKHYHHNY